MDRRSLLALALPLTACRAPQLAPANPQVPTATEPAAEPSHEATSAAAPAPSVTEAPPAPKSEPLPPADAFVYREPNTPTDNWYVAGDCPDDAPCMFTLDYAVFIAKKSWDHVYIMDYGSPGSPIREGGVSSEIWWSRVEYGARGVFEREKIRQIRGRCGLLSRTPDLYGVSSEGISVPVPAPKKLPPAPKAVSPEAANATIAAAFARYRDGVPGDPYEAFSAGARAKMTEDTLEDPRVAHHDAWKSSSVGGDSWEETQISIDVVYAATSRRVYVIDGSYYDHARDKKGLRGIEKINRKREATLVRTLQSLQAPRVTFALDGACSIPDALGDYTWLDLQLEQTAQQQERLHERVAEGHTAALKSRAAAAEKKKAHADKYGAIPRVKQGKLTATPGLDRDIIRRIVRAHRNELRHCYSQSLERDPGLSGTLTVAFDIKPNGRVGTAEVGQSSLPDKEATLCVLDAFERWKFPKPSGGETVRVRYPISFALG